MLMTLQAAWSQQDIDSLQYVKSKLSILINAKYLSDCWLVEILCHKSLIINLYDVFIRYLIIIFHFIE